MYEYRRGEGMKKFSAVLKSPDKAHSNRISRGGMLILDAVGNIVCDINFSANIGAKL